MDKPYESVTPALIACIRAAASCSRSARALIHAVITRVSDSCG